MTKYVQTAIGNGGHHTHALETEDGEKWHAAMLAAVSEGVGRELTDTDTELVEAALKLIQGRIEDKGVRLARGGSYCGTFNDIMWKAFPAGPVDGEDWRDSEGTNCAGDKWRDEHGYDRDGYDYDGYNHDGYSRKGINRQTGRTDDGYDRYGYDVNNLDRDGYDQTGYDRDGYDRTGYDRYGFDKDGHDVEGWHWADPGRYQFDRDGYDRDGFSYGGSVLYGLTRALQAQRRALDPARWEYDNQMHRMSYYAERYGALTGAVPERKTPPTAGE